MKLAVTIASEHASPLAFVVWRGFKDSIYKAAEFGYHGVELALKSTDEINVDDLDKWLNYNKLEVSCVSTGQVFASSGLYFTHPDISIRKRVMEVFTDFIYLAQDFGKMINIGRTRGIIAEGQSSAQAERYFIETLTPLCEIANECGVRIIIEPVNRYETNFINNLDQGARILSQLQIPNLGLMPDLFHMNIEDDKIDKSLIRNASFVSYIHLADSNRLAPGQGHLDFDEVFKVLKQIKFDGWASIEILPYPEPDQAALQAAKYILPRIAAYNL